jgi:hypothetical protein
MKILYFFLFLWVIFALLDPDPQFEMNADPDQATQINADPCGSGSETLVAVGKRGGQNGDKTTDLFPWLHLLVGAPAWAG